MKCSCSLLKRSLATLALVTLAACGGGGDVPSRQITDQEATEQNQLATFNPAVKPVAASAIVAGSAVVNSGGALQLGLIDMQDLKVGDVVMVEPGAHGLTNAYPGKIVSIANQAGVTTVVMTRAGIADVFSKIEIDYDSTKNSSATQTGLVVRKIITAPGVQAKFEQKAPPEGIQAGLVQTLCGLSSQAGLTWVNSAVCDYSKGTLSGELSLQKDIFVTKKGTDEKVGATWKGYFLLSDVKQVLKTSFDELASRLPRDGDYFNAELTGKVSTGVRLETPDENSKFEWALSDLIADQTGADLFDDLEWKLKYAEIGGLDGSDKAGLLPIAGLVIDAPCSIALGATAGAAAWKACGFTGALNESRLMAAKPLAFILWAYVRADGTLQFSGSLDLVEVADLGFESGMTYTHGDGAKRKFETTHQPQISMLKVNGAVDAGLTLGGELAVDFLLGGVRPAALHLEVYRYQKDFHAEGSAGFQVYPSFKPSGEICYYGTYEASSRLKVLAQLKASIGDPDWVEIEGGFQWSAEPKKTWSSGNWAEPECISSQVLDFVPYRVQQFDSETNGAPEWLYRLDLKDSYANLQHDIGKWDVLLNSGEVREVYPVDDGQVFLRLRAGESYTIELRGWHVFEDAEEVNGAQPEAIKVRSRQNLVTPELPSIGLSVVGLPAIAEINQAISLWINTTIAGIHTVVWNFADTATEKTVSGVADLFGRVGATIKTFIASGTYTITAKLMDFFGTSISHATVNVTVLPGQVSVEITQLQDDRTTPPTAIANNGTTEDTTPVLRGTIGAPLPAGYQLRLFKDGETDSFGIATVDGLNWAYTVPANQALASGLHSFTAGVVRAVDGSTPGGPRSAPYSFTVQAVEVSGVTPTQVMRAESRVFTFSGEGLPTSGLTITAPGNNRNTCQINAAGNSATGFNATCSFFTVGAQTLQINQGSRVLGTLEVDVTSNVTGVTWASGSSTGFGTGTVAFGQMVTYRVSGRHLLADTALGFAVERCGVSNTEIGTGTDVLRTYQCWFNNEAGALAGQMSGVVKDAPNGQTLYTFQVPVETAPIDPNSSIVVSWDYGSVGTPIQGRGTNPRTVAINAGVEIEGFLNNAMVDVDVSNDRVRLSNFRSYAGAPGSAVFDASAFNGLVLRVPSGASWTFSSASVGSASTLSGLTASRLDAQAQRLAINLAGLGYDASTLVEVAYARGSATPVAAGKLPHSGIPANWCHAAGGNTRMACSEPGALALNGQQDGHRVHINPMSYTKVSSAGTELPDSALSWCAVKDNVTGLIWENHQGVPGGYSNFGDNRAGDASLYAANNATMCNLAGWRLPTVDELQTIVDYGRSGPAIGSAWFPNTTACISSSSCTFWTSSPAAGNVGFVWIVNFGNGIVGYGFDRDVNLLVRLVRDSD